MKHLIAGVVLAAGLAATPAPTQASTEEKRCETFEPMFRAYGLPVRQFSFLAWRESRCVLKAVGWNYHKGMGPQDCKRSNVQTYRRCDAVKSYDVGLLQINSTWRTVTMRLCAAGQKTVDMVVLKDLGCNLRVAKYLYDNGGYGHWGYQRDPLSRASVGGERGGTGSCPAELPSGESAKCHNRTENK